MFDWILLDRNDVAELSPNFPDLEQRLQVQLTTLQYDTTQHVNTKL